MSYEEIRSNAFHLFSGEEKEFIESLLIKMGYKWGSSTPCGYCCGTYQDEYWVDGIGGNFKEVDKTTIYRELKKKDIQCSIGGYTISADPDSENEYQIKGG